MTQEKIIYIAACFVIGLLGINRRMGFWGYFFGSILLSPVVGFLLVVVSEKKKKPVKNDDK